MYGVTRNVLSVPSEHQDAIVNDFVQIREYSDEWYDFLKILTRTIRDVSKHVEWRLQDVEFVVNPDLNINFDAKQCEFEAMGCSPFHLGAKCVFTKQDPLEIDKIRKFGMHCNINPNMDSFFGDNSYGVHVWLNIDSLLDWCSYKQFNGPISIVMYKTVFGFRTYTSSDKLELNNGKIQTNGKYDAYFVKDERCLFNCKSEQYYTSIGYLSDNTNIANGQSHVRQLLPWVVVRFERLQNTKYCMRDHLLQKIGEGHRYRLNRIYHVSTFEKDFYRVKRANRAHGSRAKHTANGSSSSSKNTHNPKLVEFYVQFPDRVIVKRCNQVVDKCLKTPVFSNNRDLDLNKNRYKYNLLGILKFDSRRIGGLASPDIKQHTDDERLDKVFDLARICINERAIYSNNGRYQQIMQKFPVEFRSKVEMLQSHGWLSSRFGLLTRNSSVSSIKYEQFIKTKFNLTAVTTMPTAITLESQQHQQQSDLSNQNDNTTITTTQVDLLQPPALLFDMAQQQEIVDGDLLNSICNDLSSSHVETPLAQINTYDLENNDIYDEIVVDERYDLMHELDEKTRACDDIMQTLDNLRKQEDDKVDALNRLLNTLMPMLDDNGSPDHVPVAQVIEIDSTRQVVKSNSDDRLPMLAKSLQIENKLYATTLISEIDRNRRKSSKSSSRSWFRTPSISRSRSRHRSRSRSRARSKIRSWSRKRSRKRSRTRSWSSTRSRERSWSRSRSRSRSRLKSWSRSRLTSLSNSKSRKIAEPSRSRSKKRFRSRSMSRPRSYKKNQSRQIRSNSKIKTRLRFSEEAKRKPGKKWRQAKRSRSRTQSPTVSIRPKRTRSRSKSSKSSTRSSFMSVERQIRVAHQAPPPPPKPHSFESTASEEIKQNSYDSSHSNNSEQDYQPVYYVANDTSKKKIFVNDSTEAV